MTNGNKRNKVYNYLNFSLFPLDFVDFSTFSSTNTYFPMQKWEKMLPRTSSVVTSPTMSERW